MTWRFRDGLGVAGRRNLGRACPNGRGFQWRLLRFLVFFLAISWSALIELPSAPDGRGFQRGFWRFDFPRVVLVSADYVVYVKHFCFFLQRTLLSFAKVEASR